MQCTINSKQLWLYNFYILDAHEKLLHNFVFNMELENISTKPLKTHF